MLTTIRVRPFSPRRRRSLPRIDSDLFLSAPRPTAGTPGPDAPGPAQAQPPTPTPTPTPTLSVTSPTRLNVSAVPTDDLPGAKAKKGGDRSDRHDHDEDAPLWAQPRDVRAVGTALCAALLSMDGSSTLSLSPNDHVLNVLMLSAAMFRVPHFPVHTSMLRVLPALLLCAVAYLSGFWVYIHEQGHRHAHMALYDFTECPAYVWVSAVENFRDLVARPSWATFFGWVTYRPRVPPRPQDCEYNCYGQTVFECTNVPTDFGTALGPWGSKALVTIAGQLPGLLLHVTLGVLAVTSPVDTRSGRPSQRLRRFVKTSVVTFTSVYYLQNLPSFLYSQDRSEFGSAVSHWSGGAVTSSFASIAAYVTYALLFPLCLLCAYLHERVTWPHIVPDSLCLRRQIVREAQFRRCEPHHHHRRHRGEPRRSPRSPHLVPATHGPSLSSFLSFPPLPCFAVGAGEKSPRRTDPEGARNAHLDDRSAYLVGRSRSDSDSDSDPHRDPERWADPGRFGSIREDADGQGVPLRPSWPQTVCRWWRCTWGSVVGRLASRRRYVGPVCSSLLSSLSRPEADADSFEFRPLLLALYGAVTSRGLRHARLRLRRDHVPVPSCHVLSFSLSPSPLCHVILPLFSSLLLPMLALGDATLSALCCVSEARYSLYRTCCFAAALAVTLLCSLVSVVTCLAYVALATKLRRNHDVVVAETHDSKNSIEASRYSHAVSLAVLYGLRAALVDVPLVVMLFLGLAVAVLLCVAGALGHAVGSHVIWREARDLVLVAEERLARKSESESEEV